MTTPTIHPHYYDNAAALDALFATATDADRAAEAAGWSNPHLNAISGKWWRRYEALKDEARADEELAAYDIEVIELAEVTR
jgi:hypothetical protein